jgi:hypothetical protein
MMFLFLTLLEKITANPENTSSQLPFFLKYVVIASETKQSIPLSNSSHKPFKMWYICDFVRFLGMSLSEEITVGY